MQNCLLHGNFNVSETLTNALNINPWSDTYLSNQNNIIPLPSKHPNLEEAIECSQLLSSAFQQIAKQNNYQLFANLFSAMTTPINNYLSDIRKHRLSHSVISSFKSQMTLNEAQQLAVNDYIDHRHSSGRFYAATIKAKVDTKLNIHFIGYPSKCDKWSDYMTDLHCFAKYGSISQRSSHRLKHLGIGDFVNINPIQRHQGWKHGKIKQFDSNSGQIQVVYKYSNKFYVFWAHLDNELEIAPSAMIYDRLHYTQKVINDIELFMMDIDKENEFIINCMIKLFCGIFFKSLILSPLNNAIFYQKLIRKITKNQCILQLKICRKDNKLSLLDIPIGVLGQIMSFLSVLQIIKIERTCCTFFCCAQQKNAITSLDMDFFNKIRTICSVSKHFIKTKYFKKRFSKINTLYVDKDIFKTYQDNIKFMKIFHHLQRLTMQFDHTYKLSIIMSLPNILSSIQYLELYRSNIGMLFLQTIKECHHLFHLKLSYCFINDLELQNRMNLWDYYEEIQSFIKKIKKLELSWDSDHDDEYHRISLTLTRMLIHSDLEYLKIDNKDFYIEDFNDGDLHYMVPNNNNNNNAFNVNLVKFDNLKLNELDIWIPSDVEGNCHYDKFLIYDIIPYLKHLETLTVRQWLYSVNDCTRIAIIYDDESTSIDEPFKLENPENHFLSKIVGNNLNNLKEIRFLSDDHDVLNVFDVELWSPLFAVYQLCDLHTFWCKNIFSKFEFIINDFNYCQEKEDEDDMEWLYFIKSIINKLSPLLKLNNVEFLIKINIKCICNVNDDDQMEYCLALKCKQFLGLSWNYTPTRNGIIMYLTHKILKSQRLITDYFQYVQ